MGERSPVRFFSFARMSKTLQNKEMAIFPTLYRIPQREKKFQWIAKLFTVQNAFMSIDQSINSLEQARKLDKIGIVNGTALHQFLLQNGFTNLEVVSRPELNATKLAAGRINAWFLTSFLAQMIWEQENIETPLLVGEPISTPASYVAANIEFPKQLAKRYNQTIERMHQDETIRAIVDKYGLGINAERVIVFLADKG